MPARKRNILHSPITPVHNYLTRSRKKHAFEENSNPIFRANVMKDLKKNSPLPAEQIEVARKNEDNEWANITADFEFNFGIGTKLVPDDDQQRQENGSDTNISDTTAENEQSISQMDLNEEERDTEVEDDEDTEDRQQVEEEPNGKKTKKSQNESDVSVQESDIDGWVTDENSSAADEEDSDEEEDEEERDEKQKDQENLIKQFGETEFLCQNYYGKLLLEQKKMEKEGINEKAQKNSGNFMPTPKNFRDKLKQHQSIALRWMIWREKQGFGGILADEMGLGKTISMLALIQHEKNLNAVAHKHQCRKKMLISRATLVICPTSLIGNWEMEVQRKTKLSCILYHGKDRAVELKDLIAFDVVIMTYDTLLYKFRQLKTAEEQEQCKKAPKVAKKYKISEFPNSILAKICWKRIVLDEVHHIRNKNALKSVSCMRLEADRRWVMSGTLIQNRQKDLFPIMRFLRIPLFSTSNESLDFKMAKQFFRGRATEISSNKKQKKYRRPNYDIERVHILLNVFMLARTKEELKENTFTKLEEIEHRVIPDGVEKELRDEIMKISRTTYRNWLEKLKDKFEDDFFVANDDEEEDDEDEEEDEEMANMDWKKAIFARFWDMRALGMLIRLRQISIHFSLIRNDKGISKILKQWPQTEEIFDEKYESPKIKKIMDVVNEIVNIGDKCVIMSEWSSALKIVVKHLAMAGIKHEKLFGIAATKRAEFIDAFNNTEECKVLLISMRIGAEGLNLQGANHLLIVESNWNPQVEKQAANRLHRIGQKKDVKIHRFIMDGTEKLIQVVQQDKLKRIKAIFEGARTGGRKLKREQKRVGFVLQGRMPANLK